MIRTISIAYLALSIAGCATANVRTGDAAVCSALRPALPIAYHGASDTHDTVTRIREANARYRAACPETAK